MAVTELEIITLVKASHPENAQEPMVVTELGIVNATRPLQPSNAFFPMEVTELGMVTSVRPSQPKNASSPMEVTVFGTIVFLQPTIRVLLAVTMRALQLLRESKLGLPFSTIMLSRALQPASALAPMTAIDLGMVTLVIPLHL